jgi:hypothetical protein
LFSLYNKDRRRTDMDIVTIKYDGPSDKDAAGIPTLTASVVHVEGQMLDFSNLSGEDFLELMGKAPVVTYPGNLDMYALEELNVRFYNATFKYRPSIIFVPEGFDASINSAHKLTVITRKELKGNQFVLAYVDELSFPAYRDDSGKIDVINPGLIMAVITTEDGNDNGNNGNSNDL